MLNKYFKNFNSDRQKYLIESQILESIKMYGYDVKYIPRTNLNIDRLYGEDTLSKFENAAQVEVYIKNVDGFAGQGRFLSKFGVEVRDQITFTLSKLRFDQIRQEKICMENGYMLSQEGKLQYYANQISSFILEDASRDGYDIQGVRPKEGDLIYFPLVEKLFEIKYVNSENLFYQWGALFVYDLECEMYEYSSESFETGDSDIDTINIMNGNILEHELLKEDDGIISAEDGSILSGENEIETANKTANNAVFEANVENIVDWTEVNPLIQRDTTLKW